MGKSKPTPPKVFDPVKTAGAQYKYNRQGAIDTRDLNMIDQYTPYGSMVYSPVDGPASGYGGKGGKKTTPETAKALYTLLARVRSGEGSGGIPKYIRTSQAGGGGQAGGGNPRESFEPIQRYKVTQTFSPEQQDLYDKTTAAQSQYGDIANAQLASVKDTLSNAFTTDSLGARPQYNEERREQTLSNILRRAQPQRDRQRAAFETQLANQGFVTGTQGYNDALDERNRADTDFRLAADLASGGEARQDYEREAIERDRAVNEILQQRNQPLSELSSLLTGSQPKSASFVGTPQGNIAAPDYAGLKVGEQQALNNQYQQQLKSYNSGLSGLYGAAGSILSSPAAGAFLFSDRRLKRNISLIGKLANGLAVYAFDYIWGGPRQVGLMADEVKRVHPDAVISIGGYDAVNYELAVM